jgi:hypothetical protein
MALAVVGLLALSPLFVLYGQQARPYSLLAFVSALSLLAFFRFTESPSSRKRASLWFLSSVLLMHTHYLGGLLIALEIAYGLTCLGDHRLRTLAYGVLGGLSIVPWMAAAMGSSIMNQQDPIPHIAWIESPTATDLAWFFVTIFGASPFIGARWLVLLLSVIVILFAVDLFKTRELHSRELFLIGVALGIPIAVLLVSVLGPKPIFAGRQLLAPALAATILVGVALDRVPRYLGGAIVAALTVWSMSALPTAMPQRTKPPWRDVAEYIRANHPDEPIFVEEGWVQLPLEHYAAGASISPLQDQPAGPSVLVCRPARCDRSREPAFAEHAAKTRTWYWGQNGEFELNVYTLGASTAFESRD